MNRLIIIGNGFDLAHNLKTGYQDFILEYLKKSLKECVTSSRKHIIGKPGEFYHYKDELIELKQKNKYDKDEFFKALEKNKTAEELISFIKAQNFQVSYHFILLEETIKGYCNHNWVDIESLYFELMFNLHKDKQPIKEYNNKFDILKSKLEAYLLDVQIKTPFSVSKNIKEIMNKYNDIFYNNEESLMILNFNYTNTINAYKAYFGWSNYNVINIHGGLKDSNNPIIFGFGDEHNLDYKNLENEDDKNLFTHIKSVHYFKKNNHPDLMTYLNSKEFEVYIFGHSCGVSDRTLLKEIFEHQKCEKIKIFYHQKDDGSNDFTDKTIDIMKHFENKGEMRKKIISEESSVQMP